MTHRIKQALAVLACTVGSIQAHAATINVNGMEIQGSALYLGSSTFGSWVSLTKSTVNVLAPATPLITIAGWSTGGGLTAPVESITYDSGAMNLTGVRTAGGLQVVTGADSLHQALINRCRRG